MWGTVWAHRAKGDTEICCAHARGGLQPRLLAEARLFPAFFSRDTGLECHHHRKDLPGNSHTTYFPPPSTHWGLTNCSSELQSGLGRGLRLNIFHRPGLLPDPAPGAGSRMTDLLCKRGAPEFQGIQSEMCVCVYVPIGIPTSFWGTGGQKVHRARLLGWDIAQL